MPVATVSTFGSKMRSPGEKPAWSTSSRYARRQTSTLRSRSAACPRSSKAMTTAAAPWRRRMRAWRSSSASPSFRLIELTTHLPCRHSSPASSTAKRLLSIMIGTRATSGSAATSRRNRVKAATPSIIASSKFTSTRFAPADTCCRATETAAS
jgi:hypothetical protein